MLSILKSTPLLAALLLATPALAQTSDSDTESGTEADFRTGYYNEEGAARVPEPAADQVVIDALQDTVYELSELRHQVQQVHWNVTGPLFYSLHDMLGEFYETLALKVDMIAERKRALAEPADARPLEVGQNADLPPLTGDLIADADALDHLSEVYLVVAQRLRDRIEATGDPDAVTQDLLIDVDTAIEKQLWMLRAHMR